MKPQLSLVLGMEASSLRPSLWLASLDQPAIPLWEWTTSPTPSQQRGPGVVEALSTLPSEWHSQIRLVAVGLGPGRYAGIRACVTSALAWRLARSCDVVGVLSPDAIAAQFPAEPSLAIAGDARRSQIWIARYSHGHRTEGPALLPQSESATLAAEVPPPLIPEEGLPWGKITYPHAREVASLGVLRWREHGPDTHLEPVHLQPPVMPPPTR